MTVIDQRRSGYFGEDDCDLAQFSALVEQNPDRSIAPHADDAQHNVPIYDVQRLEAVLWDPGSRRGLMAEWAEVLQSGPGVLVLKKACRDLEVIDAATKLFDGIIATEKQNNGGGADHFATAGANDRIWNSLQKLCEASPEVFLRYFANPAIDAVCEAWLGPNYQMTAQVNLVHPGGQAQQAHRDYHLGFQTADICASYPAHVHDLSPVLTLQGAIAHCDMSIESGPTKLLPFSQLYRPGYVAWHRPEFRAYFEENCIQLPLEKGDAVFFNPALFHAAGANLTADIHRMVNLLQVSSAFGRAMESIDRAKMCRLLYPHAKAAQANGTIEQAGLRAAISSAAEGYSFPTNLDRDPPSGGLAPETQAQLFVRALSEAMPPAQFEAALDAQMERRLA
ncbi:phytanoyl-CoA dioxygenase family protein [Hoeflea sp.]|uniref:phytanoyl-CoA dioxygenase family protein n=1 Tax=Hoeflea sp. TaxID=1940281 RepID=UPI00374A164D